MNINRCNQLFLQECRYQKVHPLGLYKAKSLQELEEVLTLLINKKSQQVESLFHHFLR